MIVFLASCAMLSAMYLLGRQDQRRINEAESDALIEIIQTMADESVSA